MQPKTTELTQQKRNGRSTRLELQATSKPPQFTCAQLVGEGATPGLASSATSGHTKPTPGTAEDVMVIFDSERRTATLGLYLYPLPCPSTSSRIIFAQQTVLFGLSPDLRR